MKSSLITHVKSLTTILAQRQNLRIDPTVYSEDYKTKSLPKEIVMHLAQLYELMSVEIDLFNRQASGADRIEVPLAIISGVDVKFPEIKNASRWSTLINEGIELKYVSGSRYEWSVFMYWWSGYNKRKIERLTWYKYLNGA